jgi:hypothetical protein
MAESRRYSEIMAHIDRMIKFFYVRRVTLNPAEFKVISEHRPEAVQKAFPDEIHYKGMTIHKLKPIQVQYYAETKKEIGS